MILKAILGVVLGGVILFVLIQFIPYGHDHTNPPVVAEPNWNSPQTRELAVRACFDCHSNQTVWPWYSNVAPLSWLIQRDVNEGRQRLNFSEWNVPQSGGGEGREGREGGGMARQIDSGRMPQWYYIVLHPSAGLTAQEKQELIQGLTTFAGQQ